MFIVVGGELGARTTSILEDRRKVGFFSRICFQPKFQPEFSGGMSSSRPLPGPRSIALAAYLVPKPPDELSTSRRPRRVLAPSRAPPLSFPARRSRRRRLCACCPCCRRWMRTSPPSLHSAARRPDSAAICRRRWIRNVVGDRSRRRRPFMALVHCAMPQEVDAQLRRAEVRRSMLPAEDEKRRRRPPTVRPSMPS